MCLLVCVTKIRSYEFLSRKPVCMTGKTIKAHDGLRGKTLCSCCALVQVQKVRFFLILLAVNSCSAYRISANSSVFKHTADFFVIF